LKLEQLIQILTDLILAPSPSGGESSARRVIERELASKQFRYWVDAAGNLCTKFNPGGDPSPHDVGRPDILIVAHMDEVGMVVKKVLPDGSLSLSPLGGVRPYKFGEGPVSVVGDFDTYPGVLSLGSLHSTIESHLKFAATSEAFAEVAEWRNWKVHTKLSESELQKAGIRPGCKVVPALSRRQPSMLGSKYISGYGLDDKVGVVALLGTLFALKPDSVKRSVIIAFSTREELDGQGASWLAAEHRPETMLAVEIAPMAAEYGIRSDSSPVIWAKDCFGVSDQEVITELQQAARRSVVDLEFMASEVGGSDATHSAQAGHVARPCTIGIPVDNSHGWEIVNLDAICNVANILVEYLHDKSTPIRV
jgi:putative aminopeptidase FrvX